MSKSIRIFFTVITIVLLMPLTMASFNELAKFLGLKKVPVPVVGTGSMYPSLFWETDEGGPDNAEKKVIQEYRTTPMMYKRFPGISILGNTYLHRDIKIGDMVTFRNDKTRSILKSNNTQNDSGFIKRVMGLPGDDVRLYDGYFYRNQELVDEPYIYQPRSTYGDSSLADCETLTIPDHMYLVLGDNRKTSSDSRGELGLISDSDISHVLPYMEQTIYQSLWRDTSYDEELSGTPTLNATEFYQLINDARKSFDLPPLTPKTTLEHSASYKATEIMSGNSEYPLSSALTKAGYHNIVSGELSIRGRFTASELVANILYFDSSKDQLLSPDFTDIGIYDLNVEVDSCPTEVVVAHLGGYVPAEYDQDTIDSWRSLVSSLQEIIPSWEQAHNYPDLDQSKLQELLTIFDRRLNLAKEVIQTMDKKEWLSSDQKARIETDQLDSQRAIEISNELNN